MKAVVKNRLTPLLAYLRIEILHFAILLDICLHWFN